MLVAASVASLAGCSLLFDASNGDPTSPGAQDASTDPRLADAGSVATDGGSNATDAADATAAELPGLVGYWSFDEGSGLVAGDRASTRRDGLLVGGPGWVTGIAGTALHSDGDDDRLRIRAWNGSAFPPAGTLSLWVKPDGFDGEWILDSYEQDRDHLFLRMRRAEGSLGNRLDVGMLAGTDASMSDPIFVSSTPAAVGEWIHAILVWDPPNRRGYFYANGVLVKDAQIRTGWAPSQQLFEFFLPGCCGSFRGTLDELRLYDRPLRPEEIARVP